MTYQVMSIESVACIVLIFAMLAFAHFVLPNFAFDHEEE